MSIRCAVCAQAIWGGGRVCKGSKRIAALREPDEPIQPPKLYIGMSGEPTEGGSGRVFLESVSPLFLCLCRHTKRERERGAGGREEKGHTGGI